MRRSGVFVLSALAALTIVATATASRPRPSLTLHGTAPVVVNGAHFHGRERVKITALPGPSVSVRANSRGAFSVTLRIPGGDRCSGLIVHARGADGSFAIARRLPLRPCSPTPARGATS